MIMNRLMQNLLPLSLLAVALIGGAKASSKTAEAAPASKENSAEEAPPASARNSPAGASGLDSLCANHYNQLHLAVGKFEHVKAIIERDRKAGLPELKASLNAKNVTLYEASWGFYYLGLKAIQKDDYPNYIKYMTIAADDYLNPWAMVKLAKVYYYDKAQWKKDFPKAQITTDKDLERSYTYLTLAFVISGEIEKAHQDNSLLTGVASGGLALKDTFEERGVDGFNARKTLQKKRADLLAKAEAYQKMYEKAK